MWSGKLGFFRIPKYCTRSYYFPLPAPNSSSYIKSIQSKSSSSQNKPELFPKPLCCLYEAQGNAPEHTALHFEPQASAWLLNHASRSFPALPPLSMLLGAMGTSYPQHSLGYYTDAKSGDMVFPDIIKLVECLIIISLSPFFPTEDLSSCECQHRG